MKKIVVTGATSMIGVALIKEAIKNGVNVLAIVRKNSTRIKRIPQSAYVKILECDIEELSEISSFEERYDIFYHFAWNYTDKAGRNNPKLQARNIVSTIDAVELANRLGCRRFVGAGSQAEYGRVQGIISPDTPTNPENSYGIAKLSACNLSRIMCEKYGIEFVWGRIFSVYGCYDKEQTMINYAIDQFIKGEVAEFSAATQMWNYLNEQDAGKIFFLLGTRDSASGIYCIASKESRPLREYIEEMASIFGNVMQCKFAQNDSNDRLVELCADVSKLERDIGFEIEVPFDKGIRKVIEYRKNRNKELIEQ